MVANAIAALPNVLRGEAPAPTTGLRAPCRVDERDGYFRIVDAQGYSAATTYFDEPRAGDLSWDEARRIASNVGKLPELLGPVPGEALMPEPPFVRLETCRSAGVALRKQRAD